VGPRSPGLRDLAGRQVRHSRKLRRAPIRSEFGKMRYNYSREVMVDGKGFVERDLKFLENLRDAIVQNAAKRGRPRPTASHPQDHQPEAPET